MAHTRTPRRVTVGAQVATADDRLLGSIESVGKRYVKTADGTRLSIEEYMNTWTVI